nr:hypothetical protein CFP56_76093 [Quercus suber]
MTCEERKDSKLIVRWAGGDMEDGTGKRQCCRGGVYARAPLRLDGCDLARCVLRERIRSGELVPSGVTVAPPSRDPRQLRHVVSRGGCRCVVLIGSQAGKAGRPFVRTGARPSIHRDSGRDVLHEHSETQAAQTGRLLLCCGSERMPIPCPYRALYDMAKCNAVKVERAAFATGNLHVGARTYGNRHAHIQALLTALESCVHVCSVADNAGDTRCAISGGVARQRATSTV